MSNYKIKTSTVDINEVSGADFYFFVYDPDKLKIHKEIEYVEEGSVCITQTKYTIFAADTEAECNAKITELGLE